MASVPCKPWLLACATLFLLVPAQAQQILFDDFGSCTSSGRNGVYNTALALTPPMGVRVYTLPSVVVCPDWTFTEQSYLAEYVSGPAFPGTATKAIWLNEAGSRGPKGRMTRTLSGLTVGNAYRVTAQTWTDDIDAATALGLNFGTATTTLQMAAGSGVQSLSARVCATSSSLSLSLYENGLTNSSPVLTNVRVEHLHEPCTTPVPASSPWMLALLSALLLGVFAFSRRLGRFSR